MALLERVATLLRANLNDLIDRAEHPEKILKQVILDMENQLMQVKTQVAIAIAEHHLLESKRDEQKTKEHEFLRKAEMAIAKGHEDLARAAASRALSHREMIATFEQQVADQTVQVDNLKSALRKLEAKLEEARAKAVVLSAQHRRARTVERAADAHLAPDAGAANRALDRMQHKVLQTGAIAQAKTGMLEDDSEARLVTMERDDRVDQLLAELRARKA